MEENRENMDWEEGLKYKSATTGFTVPENYFNELNEKIEAAVAVERLKSLTGYDGYEVPANYFNQLQNAIVSQTSGTMLTQQPSRIVRLWNSNVLKYASAACFLIVAGLGIYFNTETVIPPVNYAEISTEQMLFDIDEDVIIEHIEDSALQEVQISKSDAALENYILTNYSSNELTTDY